MHWLRHTERSPAYLVKSVNVLLAFHVVLVVSKDLESVRGNEAVNTHTYRVWRHLAAFYCKRSRFLLQHHRLATLDVSLPVMMHHHVDDLFKQIRLLWAKEASRNLVNGLFQLRQSVVIFLSMVSKKGQIAKSNQKTHRRKKTRSMCVRVCGNQANWIC